MFALSADQQRLQAEARALATEFLASRAAEIDQAETYPWDVVARLAEAGFMGMTLPQAYGGRGASYFDAVLVIEEIAKACAVSARIVVEANMGGVAAVMRYGDEAQKRRVAEAVLAGDKPAICITEPGAGSAATEMTTTARRIGDRYILNGKKHWITGAGVSQVHLIFARVVADGRDEGIAGFLAFRDQDEGLKIGRREPTMGLRGMPEAEVILEDLSLPAERMIVPPEGAARGFAALMNAYNSQRVGAATVALGIAEGAYALAADYLQQREQFGRPIAEFQGLQWMLADMSVALHAAQALVYKAAVSAEQDAVLGLPDKRWAAEAKILASETAVKVTNDALQLHGAAGYSRRRPLERMVRDARMFTIGGGTAQVLRTQVASAILERKLPQTRDGYLALAETPEPALSDAEVEAATVAASVAAE